LSSTSTQTKYTLSLGVGENGGVLVFYSSDGITDDFALQVASTLQGLPWPSGTSLTLAKDAVTDVNSQADLTASPPAFS
jgi:hypothetical protein